MSSKSKYQAVYISPHLDDVGFSCSASIIEERKKGEVLVITLFNKTLSVNNNLISDQQRIEEELCAAKILNYDIMLLDEADALIRGKKHNSIGKVFKSDIENESDHIEHIARQIKEKLKNTEFNKIYFPLGIGWHIDHLIAYECHKFFKDKNILFYEDNPYCLLDGASEMRLHQLQNKMPLSKKDLENSIKRIILSYHKTNMINSYSLPLRILFKPFINSYLRGMINFHLDSLSPKKFINLKFIEKLLYLDQGLLNKKIQASECYKSQFPIFFESRSDLLEKLKIYCQSKPEKELYERYHILESLE
ncbi:MAG: PIG-L family deacetylase [Bdellovibrionales bacterium]|nr:PIG-L family deacetylase [Bdellovibrionales bacterium]